MKILHKLLSLFLMLALLSPKVKSQQWGDYTLIALQNTSTATLYDTTLTAVKTWTFASTDRTGYSTYLMPGGYLWRTVVNSGNSFTGGPICGKVQKYDYAGNKLWDYVYSTTNYCTHHDICPMPNGNVLLIAYERKTAAEATAAGSKSAIEMWPDKIVEVKPTGATTGDIVWEWHAWDHLVQNNDSTKANYYASVSDHPELLNINYKTAKDWMHMNGVDYNPMLDQIVFSSHNLNQWFVIDHSTTTAEAATHSGGNSGKGGDFLFRWGNPAGYGMTGTTILNVTHDSHWIPEGVPNSGRIVGFNNAGVSASQSSVDQINPPVNGYLYDRTDGQPFAPATYDQRHACSGYSSNMGNSQQLPNGNMLVAVATQGKVYEINAAGTTLWSKTFTGSVPQAFKYDTCFVRHEAPAIPEINKDGNTLSTSDNASYQWYKNGVQIAGATSKTYEASENGVYLVRVTSSTSCSYSYSAGYKFEKTTTGLTSVNKSISFTVFPNPTDGILTIQNNSNEMLQVTLTDLSGRMLETTSSNQLNIANYNNGVYFVTVTNAEGLTSTQKVILNK